MTAEEARTARTRRLIFVIAGAIVVLAAFLWLRRGDASGDATTSGDRAAAERGDARASDRSAERAGAPSARADEAASDDRDEDTTDPPKDRDVDGLAPVPAEGSDEDPLRGVRAGKADPSDEGTRALVAELSSTNDVVVAEAAAALIERRAVETIPAIAKIDLVKAAGSGLSIIDALGRLGAVASGTERTAALDRLLAMLAEEKKRDAPESGANLIQIYEALGRLGDPRGASALEAELLDATVPRAPKVVIVKSLVTLGQHESRTALTTARAQQAAQKGEDDFQEEIRVELVGEIDRALSEL